MWIFTYGSLMDDGWENKFQCLQRIQAALPGHARSFSKASTVNWGSNNYPAPTLRVLQQENAVCHGIAFEFSSDCEDAVISYLARREGNSFKRRAVALTAADGEPIEADCFFYNGKNLIEIDNTEDVANMVLEACGTSGSALEYVLNVKAALDRMGISDENVEILHAALHVKND